MRKLKYILAVLSMVSIGLLLISSKTSNVTFYAKDENVVIEKDDFNADIIKNEFSCASAVQTVQYNNYLYCVCLSASYAYGEQRDLIILTRYNYEDSSKTNYIVAENTATIGEVLISYPFEPNIMVYEGKVRIFFINNSYSLSDAYYCYRDFNVNDEIFSDVIKMNIYDENWVVFSYDNYSNIYKQYTNKKLKSTPIFTSQIEYYDGYWYGVITTDYGYPLFVKSDDGFEHIIIEMALTTKVDYECTITFFDGYIYFFLRNNTKENLLIYNFDYELVSKTKIYTSLTRSRFVVYDNHLFLVYSDYTTKGVTVGRNNMKVVRIDYIDQIIKIYDTYKEESYTGLVYYSFSFYEDKIYCVYSYCSYKSKDKTAKDSTKLVRYSYSYNETDEHPYNIFTLYKKL